MNAEYVMDRTRVQRRSSKNMETKKLHILKTEIVCQEELFGKWILTRCTEERRGRGKKWVNEFMWIDLRTRKRSNIEEGKVS